MNALYIMDIWYIYIRCYIMEIKKLSDSFAASQYNVKSKSEATLEIKFLLRCKDKSVALCIIYKTVLNA